MVWWFRWIIILPNCSHTHCLSLLRDSLTKQALWKFNEIGPSTANSGMGSIKAKFDLTNGPSCPSSVYVQFSSQDTILSGLEFELIGPGYRLSLVKRQFSSGRYYCEPKVPAVWSSSSSEVYPSVWSFVNLEGMSCSDICFYVPQLLLFQYILCFPLLSIYLWILFSVFLFYL